MYPGLGRSLLNTGVVSARSSLHHTAMVRAQMYPGLVRSLLNTGMVSARSSLHHTAMVSAQMHPGLECSLLNTGVLMPNSLNTSAVVCPVKTLNNNNNWKSAIHQHHLQPIATISLPIIQLNSAKYWANSPSPWICEILSLSRPVPNPSCSLLFSLPAEASQSGSCVNVPSQINTRIVFDISQFT